MGDFSAFMKKNKAVKSNEFFPATKSLCDADGNPLLWEIRAIPTKEAEVIRDECMIESVGKGGQVRRKLDTTKFIAKTTAAAVVLPDLYNAELQDSYGVTKPEDLLKEMVDDYMEFNELVAFVQKINGNSLEDDIEDAKN